MKPTVNALPQTQPAWIERSRNTKTPSAAEHERGAARTEPHRLLVVEDQFFIASEIEHWLRSAGHEVVGIATTADEAVALAISDKPDLIIMDIRIDGPRDGIDAANEIFFKTGIRCLFVTAHGNGQHQSRAAPAQPLGWLIKPFGQSGFLASLDQALTKLGS